MRRATRWQTILAMREERGSLRGRGRLLALGALSVAAILAAPLAAGAGDGEGPGNTVRGEAERGVPDPQVAALRTLRRQGSGPTDATFVNGFPRLVETSVRVRGRSPVARARSYLRRYQELYAQYMADPFRRTNLNPNQLPDANPDDRIAKLRRTLKTYAGEPASTPELDLSVRATSAPAGTNVVAFGQSYKGLPIVGADLLVFLDRRRVKATVGGLLSDLDLEVRPTLELAEAEDAARRALELGGPDTVPALGRTHLVVFAPSLLSDRPETGPGSRLAWQVALGGPEPYSAVVDAHSGALLQSSAGIKGHNGLDDYDLDLETANGNSAANSGCYWDTGDNDTLGDEDGLNDDGEDDPEAVELWNDAKQTYKFFHNTFGRHSYDNDGGQYELYVHAGVPNAGWVGGSFDCDLVDFSNGFVEFDVLVHEITHGVGDFALLGGPVYQNQSGALDESHADTMAARAESDWIIGEGVPGGPARDMSNPPGDMGQFGHPDRMSEFLMTSGDNGGVHTNSGIINKTSFLIADGGIHPDTGVQVSGIGKPAMGWLTYMAILHMPPNASFVDNRGLMVAFAAANYSNQTVCQVRNAYFAVEIGSPDTNCDGNEDNPDPDGDGAPFGQDNCPQANPSQKDTDGDGKGDVCDGDADEDGVFWPTDNCPNEKNPDQTDANLNGKGKACDPTEDNDFDDDDVPNVDDNCFLDPNTDQADVDSDGDGDACDPDTDGDGWSNDDDNSPFEPNPDQADSDGDGIGDVSDACPNTADENVAWTAGIPELGIDPVPLQPDSNGDGTPDACDRSILLGGRLTAATNFLRPNGRGAQVTIEGARGDYIKVPMFASRAPGFDDWFTSSTRRRLVLSGLDRRIKTWITDDQGRTVARPHPKAGERRRMEFRPVGGQRYFLFLYLSEPYDRVRTESFKVTMSPGTQPVRWPDPPRVRR